MTADRLHAVEHPGRPGAPLVVLVHGVLDSSESFADVATALGPGSSVVTYDRRGWARSRHAEPAGSLTDHANDLLALMRERPGIVVGHSYGGAVALLASVLRPDLVTKVGLFEPYVAWLPTWPPTATILEQGPQEREQLRAGLDARGDQTLEERVRDHALMDEELGFVAEAPFDLPELGVPLLVGRGELSVPWRVEVTDRLSSELECALVVIEGGGHTSHRVRPDQFAAFVERVHDL